MKVVFCNGCFDILHAGHVRLFEYASKIGDRLIVGINSDKSIQRLKGPSRPINTLGYRIEVLRAIRWIDDVIPFCADTPAGLVERLQPDIILKGPGYSKENVPELQVCAAELVIFEGPPISSTRILERARA